MSRLIFPRAIVLVYSAIGTNIVLLAAGRLPTNLRLSTVYACIQVNLV
jgi:hypothetical protein